MVSGMLSQLFSCLFQPFPRFRKCMALPASPVTAFPLQCAQPPCVGNGREKKTGKEKRRKKGQVSASAGALPWLHPADDEDDGQGRQLQCQSRHLSALCRCCMRCCSEGPAACAALQHSAASPCSRHGLGSCRGWAGLKAGVWGLEVCPG